MTTTKSPVSTCGVNIGFPLPRRRFATVTATRPSERSFASTMYHFRSTSLALAENVFMKVSQKRAANLGLSHRPVNGILRTIALQQDHPPPMVTHAEEHCDLSIPSLRHRRDVLS